MKCLQVCINTLRLFVYLLKVLFVVIVHRRYLLVEPRARPPRGSALFGATPASPSPKEWGPRSGQCHPFAIRQLCRNRVLERSHEGCDGCRYFRSSEVKFHEHPDATDPLPPVAARAPRAQTAAALPTSVMNSRRLMGSFAPPHTRPLRLSGIAYH
jgi:hypothetical protein